MPDPSARLRAESDERARRRDSAAEIPPAVSVEETAAGPIPLSHPAFWLAALVAAGCVLISVSFRLIDPDMWQNLTFGKAIWTSHAIPHAQWFAWPNYGAPLVNPSWGFAALIWWFWSLGGVAGLFVWRWSTTLIVFAVLWLAARRLGARGLAVLVVMVVCGFFYRQRAQIRPETLASVWFGLTLWLLETGRQGGPARLVCSSPLLHF